MLTNSQIHHLNSFCSTSTQRCAECIHIKNCADRYNDAIVAETTNDTCNSACLQNLHQRVHESRNSSPPLHCVNDICYKNRLAFGQGRVRSWAMPPYSLLTPLTMHLGSPKDARR